jgi:hypothetical protein
MPRVGRFTPGKDARYPLLQEAGKFEARTARPVANYYTDNAIPGPQCQRITLNLTKVASFYLLPLRYSLSSNNTTLYTLSYRQTLFTYLPVTVCFESNQMLHWCTTYLKTIKQTVKSGILVLHNSAQTFGWIQYFTPYEWQRTSWVSQQRPHYKISIRQSCHASGFTVCYLGAMSSVSEKFLTFWLRDASTSLTFNNCTLRPHWTCMLCKQRLVPLTA